MSESATRSQCSSCGAELGERAEWYAETRAEALRGLCTRCFVARLNPFLDEPINTPPPPSGQPAPPPGETPDSSALRCAICGVGLGPTGETPWFIPGGADRLSHPLCARDFARVVEPMEDRMERLRLEEVCRARRRQESPEAPVDVAAVYTVRTQADLDRIERLEAELDALRAGLERLAEMWEGAANDPRVNTRRRSVYRANAARLRVILARVSDPHRSQGPPGAPDALKDSVVESLLRPRAKEDPYWSRLPSTADLAPTCGNRSPLSGVACDLPRGHDGAHSAVTGSKPTGWKEWPNRGQR